MTRISSAPNAHAVLARVVCVTESDDGWGSWADLEVLAARPLEGTEADPGISGLLHVFVPPKLAQAIDSGATVDGEITFNGGPGDGIYALRRLGRR